MCNPGLERAWQEPGTGVLSNRMKCTNPCGAGLCGLDRLILMCIWLQWEENQSVGSVGKQRCHSRTAPWPGRDLSALFWHACGRLRTSGLALFSFCWIWEGCSGFLEQWIWDGGWRKPSKTSDWFPVARGTGSQSKCLLLLFVGWLTCWISGARHSSF